MPGGHFFSISLGAGLAGEDGRLAGAALTSATQIGIAVSDWVWYWFVRAHTVRSTVGR
jgi:hypothetical protein